MRRIMAALLAAALLVASAFPAWAADVTIFGADGRNLAMETNNAQFDWSIGMRNDKGESLDLCLDVTPLAGPQGMITGGSKLSVDAQESTDKVCTKLGINEQKIFKYAGNLPREGAFKLQFGVFVNAQARQAYDATITRRSPTTRVGFAGASSDGKLATSSDRAAFAWPLLIVRSDGDPPAEMAVTLRVSTFTGPGGKIITPQLSRGGQPLMPNEPLKLTPFGDALVTLAPGDGAASLADIEGAYTGEITYEVLGARAAVTLTLTRTLPDLEFKAEAISKLRGVVDDGPIGFHLHLQNTTGAARPLYAPEVFHLDRVDTASSPPTEVAAASYSVGVTPAKGGKLDFPLTVQANQPVDLVMSLSGLRDAGAYKGVVRLSASDRKPLDVPFELSLRLWWGYAAAAILIGVVLATAVRFVQQFLQPRLLLQQDALAVRGKLDELEQSQAYDLTADERNVIGALRTWLDQAGATLRNPFGSIDAATTQITAVRARQLLLAAWITARRRRQAVRPPEIGNIVDQDLANVRATLTNAAASDTDLTAALTLMNGVEARLRQRLLEVIKGAADAMRAEIAALPTLGQLAAASVRADLDAVDAAVTATRVEEARAALDRARTSYVIALSGSLRQALATPAPFGFTAAEWNTYRADIRTRLDEVLAEPSPDRRVERWNALSDDYLRSVIAAALAAVGDELQQVPLGPDVKAAWEAAKAKLEVAAADLLGHHVTAAQRDYNDGLRLVQTALTTQAAAAPPAAAPAAAAAVHAFAPAPPAGGAAPPAPTWVDTAVAVFLSLGPGATVAGVQRALVWSTLIILVLGLLVATVSGLQVLYEPNPTFGWWDLAVAFLWGAGIQAAASQAFQGLQTVFR